MSESDWSERTVHSWLIVHFLWRLQMDCFIWMVSMMPYAIWQIIWLRSLRIIPPYAFLQMKLFVVNLLHIYLLFIYLFIYPLHILLHMAAIIPLTIPISHLFTDISASITLHQKQLSCSRQHALVYLVIWLLLCFRYVLYSLPCKCSFCFVHVKEVSPCWSLTDYIGTHPVFSSYEKVGQWVFETKSRLRLSILNTGCCRPGPPACFQCPAASLKTDVVFTQTLAEWGQIYCGQKKKSRAWEIRITLWV